MATLSCPWCYPWVLIWPTHYAYVQGLRHARTPHPHRTTACGIMHIMDPRADATCSSRLGREKAGSSFQERQERSFGLLQVDPAPTLVSSGLCWNCVWFVSWTGQSEHHQCWIQQVGIRESIGSTQPMGLAQGCSYSPWTSHKPLTESQGAKVFDILALNNTSWLYDEVEHKGLVPWQFWVHSRALNTWLSTHWHLKAVLSACFEA